MAESCAATPSLNEVMNFLRNNGFKDAETVLSREARDKPQIGVPTTSSASDFATNTSWNSLYKSSHTATDMAGYYQRFIDYLENSLDYKRAELSQLLYPLLIHMYIQLIVNDQYTQAKDLIERFGVLLETYWQEDLHQLQRITRLDQLDRDPWYRNMRKVIYGIRLSPEIFSDLKSFLHNEQPLLQIIEKHIRIEEIKGDTSSMQPRNQSQVDATGGSFTGGCLKNANNLKILFGVAKEPVLEDEKVSKRKKLKESHSKKQKTDPYAPPVGRIPLPDLSDSTKEEKIDAQREFPKRLKISPEKLPSVCLYTLTNAHDSVSSCEISDDSSLLATGCQSSSVNVYSLKASRLKPLKTPNQLNAIDKESEEVLSEMFDDSKAAESISFIGHTGPVYSTVFYPDRSVLLSCSEDATIRLWSLYTWSNLVTYRCGTFPFWDVQFSPLGYYFVSGSADHMAQLWACDKPNPLRLFHGHHADVTSVKFHPNSNYIATGSADRSVRLWDLNSGCCVRHFTGHKSSIQALQFSPDGRLLVSGDSNGQIQIWHVGQARQLASFRGHSALVSCLGSSREGGVIGSGGLDGRLKLYQLNDPHFSSNDFDSLSSNDSEPLQSPNLRTSSDEFELLSLPTKSTPLLHVHFTRRNLVIAVGAYGQI